MQFYRLYYKPVYRCCCRILTQGPEAEDAMQESFIKAFDKLNTIGDAPLEAWLKRIAINTALDKLKKKQLFLTDTDEYAEIEEDDPYSEEETERKVKQVKEAINRLPDGYRIVLSLHLLEGYEYGEIADILNIQESSVRGQYTRARQKLIECIKNQKI